MLCAVTPGAVTWCCTCDCGCVWQAYMEDHLANKQRLDEEWESLQAYEADPNATSVAMEPASARKNRYGDAIPCK